MRPFHGRVALGGVAGKQGEKGQGRETHKEEDFQQSREGLMRIWAKEIVGCTGLGG